MNEGPINVKIKLLRKNAKIPQQKNKGDAGFDLYANIDQDVQVAPRSTMLIKTGIAIEIPSGYYGALHTRSGIGTKRNLRLANCTGIIDSDYRGELLVAVYNDSNQGQILNNKERFAQIVIMPYLKYDINVVDELNTPQENHDGFGSTGNK